ncbi:MAG: response regulator [Ignavibacteriales bacterium]|nr:MAG: response regulator [Ignavibacteriales bacterium]
MKSTILVMEDDSFTQQFYQLLFQRAGFDSLITDEGDKFFEILENSKVSIIILDLNLKNTYLNNEKVDGITLAKKVKADDRFNQIPILIVSAYKNLTNGRNFLDETGAEDYILKPISDFNELLKKVNNLKLF